MIQIFNIGQRGLAVTFSKEDLRQMKEGKALTGELVNNQGKTKVLFMRDRTFKSMKSEFEKKADEAKARAVEGVTSNQAAALGQQVASEDNQGDAENPV